MDMFKNLMLAGLGALSYSQEKLGGTLQDMVKRGELTKEQGEQVLSEWQDRGREDQDKWAEKINEEVTKIITKLGITKLEDFEALVARVEALENKP